MPLPARTAFVSLLTVFAATPGLGQPTWAVLEDSPYVGRHNDVYFVDAERGWAVDGFGEIYATPDGGRSWTRQLLVPGGHFRSVGFFDAETGFAGAVGPGEFSTTDPFVLYATTDGGATWSPVTQFEGQPPAGLCGLQIVNDTVAVAVGRVRGPATFARTVDGGRTWTARDMDDHAAGLIDVHFFDPERGLAVGLTDRDHAQSSCIVLATEDGGASWSERFRTSRTGEWCWKLSWPTEAVGYASLQRNERTPIYFLKTEDGGASWQEKLFSTAYYFVQGIGFLTPEVGWIGGNSSAPVYETRDGGETWTAEALRPRLNRFRFLGDTLGYAAGRQIHRLDARTGTAVERGPVRDDFAVTAAPNPFVDGVHLEGTLAAPAPVALVVYDVVGRRVAHRSYGVFPSGPFEVRWDGRADDGRPLTAERYFVQVRTGRQSRTLVVVRAR